MDNRKKVVLLKKVLDEIEAIRIRDFLAGAGIEAQVVSFHDRALDGISQIWSEGWWGEIRVFKDDLDKARAVIADLETPPENA